MLRFGSLFSGVGLLDTGFAQAGIEHVWFCESDPWRREVLRQRWPDVPVYADVRELRARDLAPVDGVVGGFPCKGVSSAGLGTGFDHPETVLWREMARVVGELRPAYVVLENVANLLTIKKGLVWQEVLETLATLGFDAVWDCIPAAAVGAPHLRDRVFAVARHAERCGWGQGERDLRAWQSDAEGCVDVAADASRQPERAQDGQADAEPGGGPAWPLPLVGGHAAAADAEREPRELRGGARDVGGSLGGRGGEARQQRDRDAAADSAQVAADADSVSAVERDGQPGALLRTPGRVPAEARGGASAGSADDARGVAVEWGEYESVVRRWEAIHGPAPQPLIRRMDDGDAKLRRVRARVDRSRLSALGDGVQVYVGRVVGE